MSALRFRSSFQVEVLEGKRLFLLNEGQTIIVENPATVKVAALIDGTRSPADIMMALSKEMPPNQVFVEIAKLQKAGHVITTPDTGSAAQTFIEGWGPATDGFSEKAAAFPVAVLDRTETGTAAALEEALAQPGLGVRHVAEADDLGDAALTVVVVEDYLQDGLAELNQRLLDEGRTWMLAKPFGRSLWVGPRFVPGETGCWECLADRLVANRQAERYVAGKRGGGLPRQKPAGLAPGAAGMTAGLIATEAFAMAAGLPGALQGELRTLDLTDLSSMNHTLVNQPQCPVSGSQEVKRATHEVKLMPEVATHRIDGGYRVVPPTETFARLEHHISPLLGAVSHLESLDRDHDGITFSFAAGHNFGMMRDNMELLRGNMRGQSGGKGRTEIQAKVSGVCEALERFSGVWTGDIPEVRSSWQDLTQRALHPNDVLQFSDTQFAHREEWNKDPRNALQLVPKPFDETVQTAFTRAWSLTKQEEVLVPSGLVWFGHPDLHEHFYAVTDSNGGASGNTLDEAILQGLCEVYERDAVALWWYNRIPRPALDLDSFQDEYIDRMRDYYATMDREIWVLDLCNDLAVPTFAAVSRRDHEVEDIMVAFGAHPDPDIALFRALTELNQFLPFIDRRDEDGNTIYGVDDPATLEWCTTTTVAKDPWVAPDPDAPLVTRADVLRELPETLGDLVQYCVDDLDRAGIETVVVNQTRPDIELAVAKVFAPGMRHFWKRTGAGRVYDVPVALGWLDAPKSEAELNPVGVFF